jgi:RNA polymerase sigma-54 factor
MHLGMHQEFRQRLEQSQRLVMTPAMVQAIRLLQLNAMELEQEVTQEMEENPFLELTEEEEDSTSEDGSRNADTDADTASSDNGSESGDDTERAPDRLAVGESDGEDSKVDDPQTGEVDDTPPDILEKADHTEDNDPEIDEYYQETYDDSHHATAERQSEERDLSQLDSAGTTLYEHLLQQLHMTNLEGVELEIGEFLIGNIDGNGYLRNHLAKEDVPKSPPKEPDETMMIGLAEVEGLQAIEDPGAIEVEATPEEPQEIEEESDIIEIAARQFDVPRERVMGVLEVIQTFDPTGVGARNIVECLLIQIRAESDPDEMLMTLVENHFDDLAHRRHKAIARAMKIPERRVAELCQRLTHLEPKPGRSISKEAPQYITPDVIVTKIEGKYFVWLNEGRTSHLTISSYYRQRFQAVLRAKGKGGNEKSDVPDSEVEYIRKKFTDARTLISNIERRKGTILRISQAIMERQREFLEQGIEHLKPMTLKDIAAEVGMHEATVSRVTSSKYVETPRGTFPLKFFFSSGLESDSGESQSSRSVRSRIRHLIEDEDLKKPLSDQRITDLLKADGIKIARRTVTKYREQMKILPTNMRRKT